MIDYYQVLQVHPQAAPAAIKKAYHLQMKRYHPDLCQAGEGRQQAVLINQAYAVLSDPEKRAQYHREHFVGDAPAAEPAERLMLRPFLCWAVILVFLLADVALQLRLGPAAPVAQGLFVAFLAYTGFRDRSRSMVCRLLWVVGGYALWFVFQGLATYAVWRYGIRAPGALFLLSASQIPALWYVLRRSRHFTKSVWY